MSKIILREEKQSSFRSSYLEGLIYYHIPIDCLSGCRDQEYAHSTCKIPQIQCMISFMCRFICTVKKSPHLVKFLLHTIYLEKNPVQCGTHFSVGTMLCWDFISLSRYHRHLPWTRLRLFNRSCSRENK